MPDLLVFFFQKIMAERALPYKVGFTVRLLCFTSKGDLLGTKLRLGNAHTVDDILDLISPLVDRYRSWFKQFGLRGDAGICQPRSL